MPGSLISRFTSRQAKYGMNTALYSVAALAIVVVVNLIANHFVRQIDLTANKRYTLSSQTQQILSKLDRDIQFVYFDHQNNFNNARDLMEQYQVESRRVKVTYVDPDREPNIAKQYNVKTYGTIVIAAGNRQEQSHFLREEEITNAVIRVLKGDPKVVYFLTGHGERDIGATDRLGYNEAKVSLEGSNHQVKTINLMGESHQLPKDASVLVVAGPQKDLLDQEITAIKEYIVKGGRVLFLVHPFTPPKLRALLEEFGADVQNNLVVDTSGLGRMFGTNEVMPLVLQYEEHPITKDMGNTATLFPMANAIQASGKKMPGVEFKLIAKTTQSSWASTDVESPTLNFRKGQDLEGPLALAGAGVYKNPQSADGAEGRIVVSGSTDLISNTILGFNGNRDFFLNMVNWLASDEDLISIRPRNPEDRRVEFSPWQMQLVKYLTLMVVPLGVVVVGLGVWWKRRT